MGTSTTAQRAFIRCAKCTKTRKRNRALVKNNRELVRALKDAKSDIDYLEEESSRQLRINALLLPRLNVWLGKETAMLRELSAQHRNSAKFLSDILTKGADASLTDEITLPENVDSPQRRRASLHPPGRRSSGKTKRMSTVLEEQEELDHESRDEPGGDTVGSYQDGHCKEDFDDYSLVSCSKDDKPPLVENLMTGCGVGTHENVVAPESGAPADILLGPEGDKPDSDNTTARSVRRKDHGSLSDQPRRILPVRLCRQREAVAGTMAHDMSKDRLLESMKSPGATKISKGSAPGWKGGCPEENVLPTRKHQRRTKGVEVLGRKGAPPMASPHGNRLERGEESVELPGKPGCGLPPPPPTPEDTGLIDLSQPLNLNKPS